MCLVCALGPSVGAHRADLAAHAHHLFPWVAEPFPLTGPDALCATATWTGVAGLTLERAGVRIAFDPFASRPGLWATLFRRPRPDAEAVARHFAGLSAVFVGHTHFDHALDLAEVARASPEARIHASRVTVELCRRLGVSDERLVQVADGQRIAVGPFEVEVVGSEHGHVPWVHWIDALELPERGLPRTPFRYPRGDVFAYRVEFADRTGTRRALHVQGSAGIATGPLLRQSPVDVLVACVAARAGTPRYLERLAERLRPKVFVPCHHDDFFRPLSEPPRPIRTLNVARLFEETRRLAHEFGTRTWLPARGQPAAW